MKIRMKMKKLIWFLGWSLLALDAFAQTALPSPQPLPFNEFRSTYFVTDGAGLTAALLNPAGLSVRSGDDGVWAGYDFKDSQIEGNAIGGLSMGSLGFMYQTFGEEVPSRFDVYSISLAIGNEKYALGTTNKLIHVRNNLESDVVTMDVGVMLNPIQGIKIAGLAENLSEPDGTIYSYPMTFTAGVELASQFNGFSLLGEVTWRKNDDILNDGTLHFGASFVPALNTEIRVGMLHINGNTEGYYGQIALPLASDLKLLGTIRTNKDGDIDRYAFSMLIPLQTIEF